MQQYKYYLSKQLDMERYYEGDPEEECAEELVIRIHKSGRMKDSVIISPFCDFVEVERKRIKAPKGYMKRLKKRNKDGWFL